MQNEIVLPNCFSQNNLNIPIIKDFDLSNSRMSDIERSFELLYLEDGNKSFFLLDDLELDMRTWFD
jgi:hypothetical protein